MKKQDVWWKDRAWRIVQTNMREFDMADMDAEQYVAELKKWNANTVIVNTGGIVASYNTDLPYHHKNQYLTGDPLEKVFAACRREGIRVISRVDFSKVRKSVYENHPEWAFVDTEGNIINYHDNIHCCFNSEYQQVLAMEILREILHKLNPDGIFMNFGGYSVAMDYSYNWHGICQCESCRRRYFEMYGEPLPTIEDMNDPCYQNYLQFQERTTAEYYANIRKLIAEEKPDLLFFHDNMLRGEIGTFMKGNLRGGNFLYKGTETIKVEKTSYPEKVSSATSVDFIDMMYRFASVSPEQQELRLAQALANGGFVDFYQAGRLDNHPNRSGYSGLQRMFRYHKEHENDYYANDSLNRILLVKPAIRYLRERLSNSAEEYSGWFNMLTQQHYLFDCMESSQLELVGVDKYDTVILPDIRGLSDGTVAMLDAFVLKGGNLVASGLSSLYTERNEKRQNMGLRCLGVERVGKVDRGIVSAYFALKDKTDFPSFAETDLLYLHDQYCYAYYTPDSKKYMQLIPPHRHSPVEEAYTTSITDFPAFVEHPFGKGKAVFIPWCPGREYAIFAFADMRNFMHDLLSQVLKTPRITGSVPPMVEISYTVDPRSGAKYVHLVNDTGFFNDAFYAPQKLYGLTPRIPWEGASPVFVTSMVTGNPCPFTVQEGNLCLNIETMELFEALKIQM